MKSRSPRKPKRTLESLVRRCCAALRHVPRANVRLHGGCTIRVGTPSAHGYGLRSLCPIVLVLDPTRMNHEAVGLALRAGYTFSAARIVMEAADWDAWSTASRKHTALLRRVRQRLLRAAGRS